MNLKAAAIALLAFALFSTHDVVVKFLGGSYSPIQTLFFVSLFSFPLTTMMLVRDPTPGNLRPVHPGWIAIRSITMPFGAVGAFYAFATLPLAQVYAIIFATPLLITVLSIPMLGEKVGIHRAAAVVVGLAGVLIVIRPGAEPMQLGHLAALTTVLAASLQSIISRKIGREERRVVMLLFPFAATFVVMGIALAFVYEPMPLRDLAGTGMIAVLGFMGALGLVVAYSMGEATIVAPMQYSQIIWATIFGYAFFGETLDKTTIIGAGVIIASGLYILVRESIGGRSENTPVLRSRSRLFSPGAFRVSSMLRRKKSDDQGT
ncbi:membrane protein [Actibacterium mucosum KCTC 23349]|uniref:Membrane protein n=1 Tax=Actibacterium mucosum KCTC 23349 TaxID=1454373 RepID=A0A037ZPJ5_9RHOB|nr:DMT family transporter [Actibacterium mucosum]KAJ57438.1 membrane protein [Actibacterium mucosum KCTC 23349]